MHPASARPARPAPALVALRAACGAARGRRPTGGPGPAVAAAYLHDVGYSALVRSSGFHPLDGARYLRLLGAPPRLAALVAHHSEARLVARACNLLPALAEFRRERTLVSDALTYADMTAGPTGIRMSPQDRFADIALRHLNEGPRVRSARSSRVPLLLAAVDRVDREIGSNPLVIAERETVMSSTLASRNADAQSRAPHVRRGYATRTSPVGTVHERAAFGLQQRERVGRGDHAAVVAGPDRRDPVELLDEQAADRVPELVPIRYGRMAVSPFTFYRGAARVMAADLAATPHSGLTVQLCGDAHLSNFGLFASPERRLVFDLNDFDETLPGPFEWDVKRLVASLVVAAAAERLRREATPRDRRRRGARYRATMGDFAGMRDVDIWYAASTRRGPRRTRAEAQRQATEAAAEGPHPGAQPRQHAGAEQAHRAASRTARRLVADPPLIVPVRDLATRLRGDPARGVVPRARSASTAAPFRTSVARCSSATTTSIWPGRSSASAAWVRGVGSCSFPAATTTTRCCCRSRRPDASVLAEFLGRSQYANNGQRVVTASD